MRELWLADERERDGNNTTQRVAHSNSQRAAHSQRAEGGYGGKKEKSRNKVSNNLNDLIDDISPRSKSKRR